MKVDLLYPSACILGEGPVWDEERQTCFWVDVEGCAIYQYEWRLHHVTHHQLEQRVSLIIPGNDDELILGLQGGIGKYHPVTRRLVHTTDLGIDWKGLRCNDGVCDVNGRLWVGTMELNGAAGQGAVYSIEKGMGPIKRMEGFSISNGMAWTADNTRLYHTDSATRKICSYKYDEQKEAISYERTIVTIADQRALPDGLALDEEGMLWVALWGGFGVARFDTRSGKMISFVDVPAPFVTSCAFAGRKLDKLIITTAKQGLTSADMQSYPLSGHVFIIDLGVKGQARYRCGL